MTTGSSSKFFTPPTPCRWVCGWQANDHTRIAPVPRRPYVGGTWLQTAPTRAAQQAFYNPACHGRATVNTSLTGSCDSVGCRWRLRCQESPQQKLRRLSVLGCRHLSELHFELIPGRLHPVVRPFSRRGTLERDPRRSPTGSCGEPVDRKSVV